MREARDCPGTISGTKPGAWTTTRPAITCTTEDTYPGDTTDPLTLNRYAYTKNSPLNYMDPGGHRNTENKFQDIYGHLPGYLTGDAKPTNTIPYAAAQQGEKDLINMMEKANGLSYNEDCGDLIVTLGGKAASYFIDALLGIFAATALNYLEGHYGVKISLRAMMLWKVLS